MIELHYIYPCTMLRRGGGIYFLFHLNLYLCDTTPLLLFGIKHSSNRWELSEYPVFGWIFRNYPLSGRILNLVSGV